MTTQPNPFSNTSDSLKNVIAAASEIIGGDPVLPDEYGSHVNAAAEEIGKLEASPYVSNDITKILQKHFNNASNGDPKSTRLQKSFQKEVDKAIHQARQKSKWQRG